MFVHVESACTDGKCFFFLAFLTQFGGFTGVTPFPADLLRHRPENITDQHLLFGLHASVKLCTLIFCLFVLFGFFLHAGVTTHRRVACNL